MTARWLLALTLALSTAACGQVEPSNELQTQSSAIDTNASSDAEQPPAPPPPEKDAGAPPSCPGRPPPGALCGSCTDAEVCCSAPEPCAGHCVPDCRNDPTKCPMGLTCEDASGVCKPPPGSRPPPPPPPGH